MDPNDNKLAGAGYILSFAKTINELNESMANYFCILSELENKYGDKPNKMKEEERNAMNQYSLTVKKFCHLSYVSALAIADYAKADPKKLGTAFKELGKGPILKKDKVEEYVIEINKFIVKNTVAKLFESSEDFVRGVYGSNI